MARRTSKAELEALRAEAEVLVQQHVFGSVRSAMQALGRSRGFIPDPTAGAPTILELEPSSTRGPSTDQAE